MSIETTITRAWQRQAAWLWLLLPLSWLYALITMLRRHAYRVGLLPSYQAPIPVMVIGNITVGGSGKTPLIISLVEYLQQQNVKVGVISRGYGGDSSQMPALVTHNSLPSIVGDEPSLIVTMTGAPMAVCPNRKQAITTLLNAHPKLQLIIADDGLQHYALQRDIEWIVVDTARGFSNKQLLPTGFLREPLSRLSESTVIYHQPLTIDNNHKQLDKRYSDASLTMQLDPSALQRLISRADLKSNNSKSTQSAVQELTLAPVLGSTVHAVSGIGYPQRFFDTLKNLGYQTLDHPYPDHYDFSIADLLQYTEYPIIVTTKDAVKIRVLLRQAIDSQLTNQSYNALVDRLWVLPVTAMLSDDCYHILRQQLHSLEITLSSKL